METPRPKYHLFEVAAALIVALLVVVLFDSHGLHNWSRGLGYGETSDKVRNRFRKHWGNMSRIHLDAPKHVIGTVWMDFQEGHKLLYPKTYRQYVDGIKVRRQRERAQLVAAKQALTKKSPAKEVRTAGNMANDRAKNLRQQSRKSLVKVSKISPVKPLAAKGLVRGKMPSPSAVEATAVPAKLSTDPIEQSLANMSVLAVGDSMMVSLAPAIKKKIASLGGNVDVDARVSTGLARPDVFDWPMAVKSHASKGRFDYIVVVMGTNDGQDFAKNGGLIPYGSKEWVDEYLRRFPWW